MTAMARKRGRNEGSIFQRADGRWCAAVDLGWESGKRRRKYIYAETRQEVAEALTKVLRDQQQGLPVATERQSVGEFLSRWLAESVRPSVRPLTFDIYEQHVSLYLSPALGRTKLSKLTASDVQRFLNRQLKRGLAPRTVQLSLVTLRRALKQGERWGSSHAIPPCL
jgi:hypothetical protein